MTDWKYFTNVASEMLAQAQQTVMTQKDYELVDSYVRKLRNGEITNKEQYNAFQKLQTNIDAAVANGMVPSPKQQQAYTNYLEARDYKNYLNIKAEAKDSNASQIVKDIASRPYQNKTTNPWENFKKYDKDTLLKIHGLSHPEVLKEDIKNNILNDMMKTNEAVRIAIAKEYGVLTPMAWGTNDKPWNPEKYKRYPDEPLNPRISKVTPFVDENTVYLNMIVDGKEKNISVFNKNTVDAFHAGAIPINVLANKALELAETKQINLESNIQIGISEIHEQNQNQNTGMRR